MFNYHQPNIDNMNQYLSKENEKNSGTGPNWWSIPSGMSSVRILPPWDPTGRVALPVFMHPIEYKSPDMAYTKYNWTCVNKTFNKPCPICEGLASMSAAGVDISNWEANRRQFYFNAIVMHDPGYNPQKNEGTAPGTHVLMKAPKTFYDWIVAQITNPMIGDITNVQNGIDVYITKEGSGLGTTYNMTLSPNGRTPIPQEYLDKITDLYNLDDVFSAGFDQRQIDELVNHLKKSAGVLSNGVGQAVSQMAGYTQAPTMPQQNYQYPNAGMTYPQNTMTPAPMQFNTPQTSVGPGPVPQNTMTPAPTPFGGQVAQPPVQPVNNFPMTPPQPSQPAPVSAPTASAQSDNLPKCFGNYDAGSVNCVVCPMEIQCSQSKK